MPSRKSSPAKPQASWPELEPFTDSNLPAFPVEALPPVLGSFVSAVAYTTQTPPDMAAMVTLGVVASTIARDWYVEARPGFQEPVNTYSATLVGPANRKSAVFRLATQPLQELEKELIDQAKPRVAAQEAEQRRKEHELSRLEKVIANGESDSGEVEARDELIAELATWRGERLPRLLADNATPEKLEMLLAENRGRIASMSAEGTVFDMMRGKYGNDNQFDVYLKAHPGDDIRVDRVGREGLIIERPALTCAFVCQPSVLDEMSSQSAFRNRGVFGRFLFSQPASWIGSRQIGTGPVPDEVQAAYRDLVRELALAKGSGILPLDGSARAAFEKWELEIEGMLAEGGEMELIPDWGGKLAGATLRLAAGLHAAELSSGLGGREITLATIENAIKIARYLIPHAEAVLTKVTGPEDRDSSDALYLLRWIQLNGFGEFTRRDAHQHGRRRFASVADVDPALEGLERRGYIRPLPDPPKKGSGRHPSPRYEVNPMVLATSDRRQSGDLSNQADDIKDSEKASGNEPESSTPARGAA